MLTKENAQIRHLWEELLKSTSKIWKPSMFEWPDAGNNLKASIIITAQKMKFSIKDFFGK